MLFLAENFNNYLFSLVLAGLLLFQLIRNPNKHFTWIHVALAALMLLAMRLPVICFNNQLNVDESQMVANLRVFRLDPIYWKSIDGGTIGPVAYYIAWLATYFFEPLDFTSIRWLGFVCLVFNLILFYQIAKKTTGVIAANFSTFLLVCFFSFLSHPDFLHYSSEQLPVLLINLTIYLQVLEWRKSTRRIQQLLIGFIIGLIPYVKIQAIPICGIMAIFQLIQLYTKDPHDRVKNIGFLFIGLISFTGIFILWANYVSVLDDFWIYYIEDNLLYTAKNKTPYGIVKFVKFMGKSFDFFALLVGGGLLFILAAITNFKAFRRNDFAYFSLLFFSGLFAATITRNNFPHYLYLVIFPIGFVFAFSLTALAGPYEKYRFVPIIILVGWFVVGDLSLHQISTHLDRMKRETKLSMSPVGNYLHQISKSGDRMSVWGWQGKLYLEADILQASTENHTLHCMQPSMLKNTHIKRYLEDLERSKARILVDASQDDPGYLATLEKVPEIDQYVKAHYTLDTTISNNRIFIRRP